MGGIRKGGIKAAIKSAPKRKVSKVSKGGVKSGGGYKKATVTKPKPKAKKKPVGSDTRNRVLTRDAAEGGRGFFRRTQDALRKKRLAGERGGTSSYGGRSRAAAGAGFKKPNPAAHRQLGGKFKVYSQADDQKIQ